MENYLEILMDTELFAGISREDLSAMLECLGARVEAFPKDAYILHQGQELEKLPILVAGKLYIQTDDYWGNRSILGHVEAGEMFGEAFAAPRGGSVLNDVVAVENSVVVFLDMPPEVSDRLIAARAEKNADRKKDIHEKDSAYLHRCHEAYSAVADKYGWARVQCSKAGEVRSIEDIHDDVYNIVQEVLKG